MEQLPKAIGWGVVILVGYCIMEAIMPYFMWGLMGLVFWYCYLKYQESQRPPPRR